MTPPNSKLSEETLDRIVEQNRGRPWIETLIDHIRQLRAENAKLREAMTYLDCPICSADIPCEGGER